MTLPEWVDPTSPDDPRASAGDQNRRGAPPPVPPDPVLAEKPVLEWTKDDWARWIESSSRTPGPATDETDVAPAQPGADTGGGGPADVGARVVDPEVDAGRAGWPAVAGPDGEGPWDEDDGRPWDEESGFPIVDIRLPDDEAPDEVTGSERPWDEPGHLSVEVAESVADGPSDLTVDTDQPWDEPPELGPRLDPEREDESAGPAVEAHRARPDVEDPSPAAESWADPASSSALAGTAPPPQGEPDASAEAEIATEAEAPVDADAETEAPAEADSETETEDDWPGGRFGWSPPGFGVPAPLPPSRPPSEAAPTPGNGPAGRAGADLAPPPLAWPIPDDPPTMEAAAFRAPTRAVPSPRPTAGRRHAQPHAVAVERSHRMRSAIGLLAVAVIVGVVVAGLITVTVFAIGVALRRAVG